MVSSANLKHLTKISDDVLERMRVASEHIKEVMERYEGPMREAQEIADRTFEQMQRTIKDLGVRDDIQRVLKEYSEMDIWRDLDRLELSDDITESEKEIVEQKLSYAEAVSDAADEVVPISEAEIELRLGPSGMLFNIEQPKKGREASPKMHALIRALTKRYTPTMQLMEVSGYKTEQTTRVSIQKLNRWGIHFGLPFPLVIGSQGKGYKLNDKLRLHKVPMGRST